MTVSTATLVDRLRRHYDDGCFACGRENPIGLHLDAFALADGEVSARFDPRPNHRGAGRALHGGIAATALDEILVWAGILLEGVMSVTGTMEIRYRHPVEIEEGIQVRARVDDRRGRRMKVSGDLLVSEEVRIQASGLYLVTQTLEEMGILAGSGGHHAGNQVSDAAGLTE